MRVFFSRFAKPYTLRYSYKTGVILDKILHLLPSILKDHEFR